MPGVRPGCAGTAVGAAGGGLGACGQRWLGRCDPAHGADLHRCHGQGLWRQRFPGLVGCGIQRHLLYLGKVLLAVVWPGDVHATSEQQQVRPQHGHHQGQQHRPVWQAPRVSRHAHHPARAVTQVGTELPCAAQQGRGRRAVPGGVQRRHGAQHHQTQCQPTLGVEHRRAEAAHPGQQAVHHAAQALAAGFLQQGLHFGLRLGHVHQWQAGLGQLFQARQFFAQHGRDAFAVAAFGGHEGGKTAAGGRGEQGHDIAQAQGDRHRLRCFGPVHHGRPLVAPDGNRQGVPRLGQQGRDAFARELDGVDARQAGQP